MTTFADLVREKCQADCYETVTKVVDDMLKTKTYEVTLDSVDIPLKAVFEKEGFKVTIFRNKFGASMIISAY